MDVIIEDIDEELYKKENQKEDKTNKKNIKNNKGDKVKKKKKKNKKVKKLNIYLLIISIIWLFMIFLNTFLVFRYDVLPLKYLIVYLVLVVLLPVVLLFLLTRKKINKGFKIFVSVVAIINILILSFSFFYLNKTFSFLDDFTSGYNYETKNYVVMVLKNSDYQEIDDLDEEKIGYVKHSNEDLDKIFKNLEDEISFAEEEYKEYSIALNDLDNKEIKAIVLGDSYYQMLSEDSEEFDLKYKVIYEFSLKEKVVEIKKEADVTKDTFNFYISGIDSYGSVNSLTRSDVNIVVSINPKTNQILMINIPRDYYVEFPGTDSKDKLTHAGIYGIDMSVKTIENLLDTEINYYFKVNYAALVNLVDALGGVDVYSKYTFKSAGRGYYFKKGYNHVSGLEALDFVRTRKAFKEGDRVRGENQQAMIQAIIKKAMNPSILTNYSNILNSLSGSFATNLGTDKITDLVKLQLNDMPNWNITSISLSGSDGSDFTYTYPYQKLYVMVPDENTISNAKESLNKVSDGKKLENSYEENKNLSNGIILKEDNSSKESLETKSSIIEKEDINNEVIVDNTDIEINILDSKNEEIISDDNLSTTEEKEDVNNEVIVDNADIEINISDSKKDEIVSDDNLSTTVEKEERLEND